VIAVPSSSTAPARRDQARERAQERRLAAPVGADDGRDPPAQDLEVELAHHRRVAVGDGQAERGERRRSHRK
jgi:hypothetical protein